MLAAAVMLAVSMIWATDAESRPKKEKPVPEGRIANVQILGFNDFHGNLQPRTVNGQPAGGAAYLAAYLDRYEAQNPKGTIRVHDGDLVGASPLISSYFHDEPTIEATNLMDLDLGTLGNHEFDDGGEEMFRLLEGGQRTDEAAFKEDENGDLINTSDPNFEGTDYPYVSANSVYAGTDDPILPPYQIVKRDGAKVGFIGVNTPETERIVVPDAVSPYDFLDISDTVNRYVPELQKKGVEAIVVLAHSGGYRQSDGTYSGEIITETPQMSDAVDVVISGHSHSLIDTEVDGKLIVQAWSYGTAFEDIDLRIDRKTKDVIDAVAEVITTYHQGIKPDPEVQALVDEYAERIAPIANRVVNTAGETITRTPDAEGESALGDLIADAQRDFAGTDFAFMNPGGIRDNVEAGEVTYGELFAVQPFENGLVKMELTGQQVIDLLEQQFQVNRILQISGLQYTYTSDGRITSVTLPDGSELDPNATYTVAANGYIATGGDGFTVFTEGQNVQSVGGDLEALVEYLEGLPEGFGRQNIEDVQQRITKEG
jgi:5'-nucleotidase